MMHSVLVLKGAYRRMIMVSISHRLTS